MSNPEAQFTPDGMPTFSDEFAEDELLFWRKTEDGRKGFSCTFKLYPPEAGVSSSLIELIQVEGGIVVTKLGPYTIPVIDEGFIEYTGHKVLKNPEDHFSSKFIIDSVAANRILDLNNYRAAGSDSKFEDYDPNLILKRVKTWSDLTVRQASNNIEFTHSQSTPTKNIKTFSPLTTPNVAVKAKSLPAALPLPVPNLRSPTPQLLQERSVSANSKHQLTNTGWRSCSPSTPRREKVVPVSPMDDLAESDFESVESASTSNVRSRPKRRFTKYSIKEDKEILQIISRNRWYTEYKGMSIWRTVEAEFAKAFPNSCVKRPSQGLREHFITVMAAKLMEKNNIYGLPPETLKRFRNGIAMKGKKY